MPKMPHTRAFRSRRGRNANGRTTAPQQDGRADGRAGAAPPSLRRKTVVVVEDTATFGGLLVALLKEEGYQAMRAWSAREAAKMARDRRPELVMVDLSLPYPERVELVDELLGSDELADKPLLVVSSHAVPFLKDGPRVADVVNKPFDIDRLLNSVRKALGEPELDIPEKQYEAQDSNLHGW